MKRNILIVLFICMVLFSLMPAYGYADFEDFKKVGDGKTLSEFQPADYDKAYKKIGDPSFLGWKHYEVTKEMKVTYTSETLFSYYNNGKSPIVYNYKASKKTINSYQLKVSGGIKLQTQKDNKVFGSGLTAHLNMDYILDKKTEDVESYDIKVSIEPTTQMVLYLYGEGKISNGVAKNYLFWFEVTKGGYEIFVVTTHYQRLEITPI